MACRLTAVPTQAEEADERADVRVHEAEELHGQPLHAMSNCQDGRRVPERALLAASACDGHQVLVGSAMMIAR